MLRAGLDGLSSQRSNLSSTVRFGFRNVKTAVILNGSKIRVNVEKVSLEK